ncbi:GNAT family N-acetyltransferase [Variovorax sp. NFACC27]
MATTLGLRFQPLKIFSLEGWKGDVPTSYELRRIDERLMQQIRDVANPYSLSYWRPASDFEQHGLGFCATYQDSIVSMCYTAFAWHGHHDIDILTTDSHQQRAWHVGSVRVHRPLPEAWANPELRLLDQQSPLGGSC